MGSTLTPVLILASWSLVMWIWMYATRIPAMQKAGIDPAKMKEKSEMDVLPRNVRQVADNYNHLHEQPVIFYALALYTHLAGNEAGFAVAMAWAYVILRVAHSIYQALVNFIPVRFALFALSSLSLIGLAIANLLALAG
ncbi:MAG: MAPEG family protein [Pseudomonadota bacterium]